MAIKSSKFSHQNINFVLKLPKCAQKVRLTIRTRKPLGATPSFMKGAVSLYRYIIIMFNLLTGEFINLFPTRFLSCILPMVVILQLLHVSWSHAPPLPAKLKVHTVKCIMYRRKLRKIHINKNIQEKQVCRTHL